MQRKVKAGWKMEATAINRKLSNFMWLQYQSGKLVGKMHVKPTATFYVSCHYFLCKNIANIGITYPASPEITHFSNTKKYIFKWQGSFSAFEMSVNTQWKLSFTNVSVYHNKIL